MENEDGQLRAKENIYSKNSKIDKKFNKKRLRLGEYSPIITSPSANNC